MILEKNISLFQVNDLNLVWSVNEETCELIPIEEFWGQPMKYDVLMDDRRVLVFDFGAEVYVWKRSIFSIQNLNFGSKIGN